MKIETSSIETEILKLLGKLHVLAHDQLFRLLPEFDRYLINRALTALKNLGYLSVKEYAIPAPNSGIIDDETKKVSCLTYALNCKSRPAIIKKFPILQGYRREGPVRLCYQKRVYRDLLIAEALIYLTGRYIVADIFNEECLPRTSVPAADLRLKIDDGAGNFSFLEVEVVAANDKKALLAKPNDRLFFTYSSRQADIIKKLKGVEATIVTVDGAEIKTENADFAFEKYDSYYLYVYDLKLCGGALTAQALAITFKKDEAETAAILEELEENGHLFSDRARIKIGDPDKRPPIYAINRQLLMEPEDRALALMCSNLIVHLKEEASFGSLDRSRRIAYFRHNNGEHRRYYFENPNESVLKNYCDFKALCREREYAHSILYFQFASRTRQLEYFRPGK